VWRVGLEHYELVETPEQLQRGLDLLAPQDHIGVDVERADWDRYFRAAALIQVGGQGNVLLVDPLALPDWGPLDDFLAERTTVLHAMENDLGPMASVGVSPPHVEDTAIAAGILGLPTGLEGLLADLLGVELEGDKSAMQRANWEERPLTEEMLRYAAGDVADLPALWHELAGRLDDAGRMDWYRQELAAALALPAVSERRDWTRTKGAGRLDPAARMRLRVLWEARETLARDTNTAPGRIMADKMMVELATHPPAATRELARRGMRRQAVRDFGEAIMQAVQVASSAVVEAPVRQHRQVTEQDRALVDKLRASRANTAREIGIDSGILCPSRTLLTAVIADPQDPGELRELLGLRPWQWEILGHDFCAILGIDGPGIPDPRPARAAGTDAHTDDNQEMDPADD
jgi:ribonuclease D